MREPVEQLRVRRPRPLHEVLLGLHQAAPEVHLPVAVYRHAGGQRMIGGREPARQPQPVAGQRVGHGAEHRGHAGFHCLTGRVVPAAHEHVRGTLRRVHLLHDHDGGDCVEQLLPCGALRRQLCEQLAGGG